jgi:hypothetical protein
MPNYNIPKVLAKRGLRIGALCVDRLGDIEVEVNILDYDAGTDAFIVQPAGAEPYPAWPSSLRALRRELL